MTDERAAFERAVGGCVDARKTCGEPVCRTTLGAYADWLDERGLDSDLAHGLRSWYCPSKATCYLWYDNNELFCPGHLDNLPHHVYVRLKEYGGQWSVCYDTWQGAYRDLGRALRLTAPRRRSARK